MNLSLEEERLLGEMCEDGLVTERYDEATGELKKKLTLKGLAKVRDLLKDPYYQKKFKQYMEQ
jgi:hypothetical protein